MALFRGTNNNDSLLGSAGNDEIYGGAGDDLLRTGGGNDRLFGEAGNDFFLLAAGDHYIEGGAGNDRVEADEGALNFLGQDGNDLVFAQRTTRGGLYDGGAGDDTIYAGSGADTLVGAEGKDDLYGGLGDDTYVINSNKALIVDDGGNDRAFVGQSWFLVPGTIESVTYAPGVQPLPYWIGALVSPEGGGGRFSDLAAATNRVFGYTFPTSAPAYLGGSVSDYTAFTAAQQASTTALLAHISSFADLRFTPTDNANAPNVLAFAMAAMPSGVGGYASLPSSSPVSSDITLTVSNPEFSYQPNTRGAVVLVHEVGHALGLRHPFAAPDAVGGISPGPYLNPIEDSTANSMMSYTFEVKADRGVFADLDIAALQWLYGPNPSSRAGNDTYRVRSDAANFIWDGAGVDTVDLSDLATGATVYLEPGYWGYVGASAAPYISAPGQVTVNFGTVIENLLGTAHPDTLTGNSASNLLQGGAGADVLRGGGGDDRIDGGADADVAVFAGFAQSYSMVSFDSMKRELVLQDFTIGRDGRDTLVGIEALRFADTELPLIPLENSAAELVLRMHQMYQIPVPTGDKWAAEVSAASTMAAPTYATRVGEQLAGLSTSALVSRAFAGLGVRSDLLQGEQASVIPGVLGQIVTTIIADYRQFGDRHFWLMRFADMLSDLETDPIYGQSAIFFNGEVQKDWITETVTPKLTGIPGG